MNATRMSIAWLTAAVVVSLIFGSVYASFQQLGRRTANDAPAAAAAAQLQTLGAETVPPPRVELNPESGIFVITYGPDDQPVSGTATLHGTLPALPAGVLQTARTAGSDAVTWQPEPGLRMAVVARSAAGKVIVAGQSLAPYEDRDRMLLVFLTAGWLGSMVVLAAGYASTELLTRRRPARTVDK
ncbi:hypothetical protein [Arthrobacter sp. I3]|uniref:hypothetical protein n=1 Tax=Arthrobacter sp. I3 TaxID=218158 RepID=UPI000488898C|nr:hypothetical protein [Arthrobacter sp. I3]